MPNIKFPYGKDIIEYYIPDDRFKGELVSRLHKYKPKFSQEELVRNALENPIDSLRLKELAKNKKNIVIIASDHTRPVPSKIIMPCILSEIREGNPNADITILIATGCHRGTMQEELEEKFGFEIYKNEKIIIHDCDNSDMVVLGKMPSGGEITVNKIAAESDLLISEGFIEPHFFAGFSGGRKSVMPGIASRKTVMYNHNAEFIDNKNARAGIILNNPVHEDMIYAAKAIKLAFICNVVLNSDKEIIYAVAGDCDSAHKKGCDFLSSKCKVNKLNMPADIVITTNGGYPLDQNIYQAVKGMTTAESAVKKDGVIIMLAQSKDGHGGESFYKTFAEEKDLDIILAKFLSTPKNQTLADQWQSQIFARVLKHARVIYVSDAPDNIVSELGMIPAGSIDAAVKKAEGLLCDADASIAAIPDGVGVIVSGDAVSPT